MSVNENDASGYYMKVTLVNGSVYEGTVFTYNPKEGVLVLLDSIGSQPNMRMIRTPYIKEFDIKSEGPAESELPPGLEPFTTLPSMHAGRDKSIFKHASTQLKASESTREKQLADLGDDTPIAATDAFLKLIRLYPQIEWVKDEGVIMVSNTVIVAGKPDWKTPTAMLVDPAAENDKPLVDRVQHALDNNKK